MKISEIEFADVANFLKLDLCDIDDEEKKELDAIVKAAKSYVFNYTGLSETECDTHEDLTIAALILCQDMYDNRSRNILSSSAAPNKTLETILGMYCNNLI